MKRTTLPDDEWRPVEWHDWPPRRRFPWHRFDESALLATLLVLAIAFVLGGLLLLGRCTL